MRKIFFVLVLAILSFSVCSEAVGSYQGNSTFRQGKYLNYLDSAGDTQTFDFSTAPTADQVWTWNDNLWSPSASAGSQSVCQGRLTLESGVPISTADQTAKTEIYLTPYNGNWIGIYDGADWGIHTFSEIGISTTEAQTGTTTDTTYNITGLTNTEQLIVGMAVTGTGVGADAVITGIENSTAVIVDVASTATGENTITFKIPASKNVDIFAVDDSGVELRFGPLWTDDATRATALTTQDGIKVLTESPTYRYLGSVGTGTTAGQVEDSTSLRHLYNKYNKVGRPINCTEPTNSWTYTTATWRAANNNIALGQTRISVLNGDADQLVSLDINTIVINAGGTIPVACGVGVDSTTTNSAQLLAGVVTNGVYGSISSTYIGRVAYGRHYYQQLEISGASGTTTWCGDLGVTYMHTGMCGLVET